MINLEIIKWMIAIICGFIIAPYLLGCLIVKDWDLSNVMLGCCVIVALISVGLLSWGVAVKIVEAGYVFPL